MVGLLELARRTMRLHTCALYWADAKGRALRIVEAASDAPLVDTPLPVSSGVLGATFAMAKPLLLANLRPDHPGLTHYVAAPGVRCFAGVPVLAIDGTQPCVDVPAVQ